MTRGKEAYLEYLEMWFKERASEERKEKLDPQDHPELTDPPDPLVLRVFKVFKDRLVNLV